jgi:TorA maturation chaperone TorD
MMKTLLLLGTIAAGVVILASQVRKWSREEAAMQELDQMLAEILGGCMEAYCEDCDHVLAQGTNPFHEQVAQVAYFHRETYDHEVRVRSWAELWT